MTRTAGPLFACALALISAQASAQTGVIAPAAVHPEADQKAVPSEPQRPVANRPQPTTFAGHWKRLRQRMASPSNFSLA